MISLRYLYSRIKPYIVSAKLSDGWDTLPYEIGFVGSRGLLRSGRLYITSPREIVREVSAERGAAVIVCNAEESTPTEGPGENTFISLSCKTSVVYDLIDDAVEFSRAIDARLATIDNNDIASKTCILAAQLSNGVAAFTDPNGFIIATSSGNTGDEKPDYVLSNMRTMREWINDMKNIGSLVGDLDAIEGTSRKIFGHQIGSDRKPKGYIFVEAEGSKKDCLAVVTKTARFLDTHYSSNGLLMPDTSTVEFSKIWGKIVKRQFASAKTIAGAFLDAPISMKRFVSVGIVSFESGSAQKSLSYLVSMLKMLIPETNFAIFADEITLCMSSDSRWERPVFSNREKIDEVLKEAGARLFLSTSTRRYEGLYSLYQDSKRTSVLMNSIGILEDSERIVFSEDYNTYYIIDLAVRKYLSIPGNDDIVYLMHPAMAVLTRYDRKHNTNLRKTLYYYLINDCNLVKTAEAIYMHRNTVLNKVNKIRELVGSDLSNPLLKQKLILSYQLALYQENILNREIG